MFNESIGSVATEEIGLKLFPEALRVPIVRGNIRIFEISPNFLPNCHWLRQRELRIRGFGPKSSHFRRKRWSRARPAGLSGGNAEVKNMFNESIGSVATEEIG